MKERIKELIAVIQHECMNNYYGDKPFESNFYDKHADEIMKLSPQWIPVSERLPEEFQDVVLLREGVKHIGCFENLKNREGEGILKAWDCPDFDTYKSLDFFTHWCELPELPENK